MALGWAWTWCWHTAKRPGSTDMAGLHLEGSNRMEMQITYQEKISEGPLRRPKTCWNISLCSYIIFGFSSLSLVGIGCLIWRRYIKGTDITRRWTNMPSSLKTAKAPSKSPILLLSCQQINLLFVFNCDDSISINRYHKFPLLNKS